MASVVKSNDPFYGIRKKDRNHEVCLKAVEINGLILGQIEFRTHEICCAALKQNGNAIQYIENPSEEYIKLAFANKPKSLRFCKNLEMPTLVKMVVRNGYNLRRIHPSLITPNLYWMSQYG